MKKELLMMKKAKTLLFAILLCAPLTVSAQDVEINAENFPDENFRNWLLEQSYGKDGVITETEIKEIAYIDVSNKNISSLKGIEFFTTLISLNCSYNQLTALDVTNNKALSGIQCYFNEIKGEAMSALINSLPEANHGMLYVCNFFGAVEGNIITKSQVATARAKGWVPCATYNDAFWSLNYEGSDDPEELNGIAIEASNFPDENFRNWLLEQSYGKDGVITETEIKEITSMNVNYKHISSLEGIEHFTALTELWCDGNQMTTLDVSNNTALVTLHCSGGKLASLNISRNTALTFLNCWGNQLTTLNVSGCTALETLTCYSNQLAALDVSNLTALTFLSCSSNQLTSLDISHNLALTSLSCYANWLATLDVSHNTALAYLRCHDNQLISLNVSGCIELKGIECSNNQLTSLDVSHNPLLTDLDCFNNQLTSLDVSHNPLLTNLNCNKNQLTFLDTSQNIELTFLNCSSNQLAFLDLSQNIALTNMYCYGNQLTSLDTSHNIALTWIDCSRNQIKGNFMDAFIISLPSIESGKLHVYDNTEFDEGNICTKSQVIAAKIKGWTPYYYALVMWGSGVWVEYEGSDDEATGITLPELESTNTDALTYNLSGQKVTDTTKKGIYIVNGKKVVVK